MVLILGKLIVILCYFASFAILTSFRKERVLVLGNKWVKGESDFLLFFSFGEAND